MSALCWMCPRVCVCSVLWCLVHLASARAKGETRGDILTSQHIKEEEQRIYNVNTELHNTACFPYRPIPYNYSCVKMLYSCREILKLLCIAGRCDSDCYKLMPEEFS